MNAVKRLCKYRPKDDLKIINARRPQGVRLKIEVTKEKSPGVNHG
jgi:hypothetical protein